MGIFGTISKALFGGKKKTTSAKTSEEMHGTSTVAPYAPAIPYINDYLSNTAALYRDTPQFSPLELEGVDLLRSAVAGSNTALDPAIAENNKTLSGAYLDPDTNPYLAGIAQRMADRSQAAVNATFGGGGRANSGLAAYELGEGVAGAVGDVYGSAYDAERNRMGNAVGMAPSLSAGKLVGPGLMLDAGQSMSARPFDINQQYGGILSQIGSLGRQGTVDSTSSGTQQNYKQSSGLLGKIASSLTNKLFGV